MKKFLLFVLFLVCVGAVIAGWRSSRPAKRESVMRSSRPITFASASNCSCLFAAMLISPSRVRNAPDGAAVMLSLPWACGSTPAIR